MHLPDCVYRVSFQRYRSLKLRLSCEILEKGGVFGPRFVGEGIPQIWDIHFQIVLTSEHVARFGLVLFGERGE